MADHRPFARLAVDPRTGTALDPAVRDRVQESALTIMTLIRNVEGYRRRLARSMGVSVTELRALGRIAEGQSTTPSHLAEELGLTTGSVTPLLDRLEQAGLLRRVPHAHDRRSVAIELTPEGDERIGRAYRTFQDRLLAAVEAMPAEAVADVNEFLRLAAHGYEPVEDPCPEDEATVPEAGADR